MENEEKQVEQEEATQEENPQAEEEQQEEVEETEEQTEGIDQDEYDKLVAENASLKRDLKKATKPKKSSNKSTELDWGQKAYLRSEGIERDDFEFVQEVMQDTGKDLDELLGSKYFKAELDERVAERKAKAALPKGSKRSSQSASNDVDYWLAKGKLPPKDQPDLRRKVVNAKLQKEKDNSRFSPHPVVK